MQTNIIYRHRKENLKKCSLRGLEVREDLDFYTYPKDPLPFIDGYILLTIDAPTLSIEDQKHPLFLIDATWKYAETMQNSLPDKMNFIHRSLPSHFRTAYPRRQEDCPNPELGLASVEALYLSYFLLGLNPEGLLDHYHWKEQFLDLNQRYLKKSESP